jgi:cobalt/nickel transport system permease protein
MHLADGTLSNSICTATAAVSAAAIAWALSHVREHAAPRDLLRAGIGAAVVFGAQTLEAPLFGAVGVHLIGAAFLTLLSGPALALLAMTAVIAAQGLLFGDGGLITIGANVLNMGVAAVATAYAMTGALRARRVGTGALLLRIAAASTASVFAAVAAMSIELALSGAATRATLAVTMPAQVPFVLFESIATVVLVIAAARVHAFDAAGAGARATR